MELYKTLAKEYLSECVETLRKNRCLTQEEMAEQLRITCRAYGDLERGKYCFSTISLLFLLLLLNEEERSAFLLEFRNRIYALEQQDVA